MQGRPGGEALEHVGEAVAGDALALDAGEGKFDIGGAARDFVAEQGGFDIGEAAETPAGGGHGLDQLDLDGGGGGELIEIGVEETREVGGGFVGEDDGDGREGGGAGGEAVADGVLGGAGAALRSGGAMGFGAVDAGGGGSTRGRCGNRVSGHLDS
ncbi:MAG: hypothetical protein ABI833_17205, partial [Acidobacteriota bacterium]